jgi:hypothetical protein
MAENSRYVHDRSFGFVQVNIIVASILVHMFPYGLSYICRQWMTHLCAHIDMKLRNRLSTFLDDIPTVVRSHIELSY